MIIFIRHGEKTDDEPVSLSHKGEIRAKELVKCISETFEFKIDLILAMKQNKHHTSNRPYETVKPLADHLGIDIVSEYTADETKHAANWISENITKNILVCWEHSYLVEIIKHFTKLEKIHWGENPFDHEDPDDYTSIWCINNGYLEIYRQFEIHHNTPDYSKVSSHPILTIKIN